MLTRRKSENTMVTISYGRTYSIELSDMEREKESSEHDAFIPQASNTSSDNLALVQTSKSGSGSGGGAEKRRNSSNVLTAASIRNLHLERMYSSCSSFASTSSVSKSPHDGQPTTTAVKGWVRTAWAIHYLGAFAILTLGMWNNNWSRKYTPISVANLRDANDNFECDGKAFVNVMAPSRDADGAVICCEDGAPLDGITSLCGSVIPLAGRMNRFPDAWLIPIFPLLLRLLYVLYKTLTTTKTTTTTTTTTTASTRSNCTVEGSRASCISMMQVPAFRRLAFYMLLLNFRGWILYLLLNTIEDNILVPPREDDQCWYQDYLKDDIANSCQGRLFDFSDHVVLFFAQVLPIALLECCHTWEYPYWSTTTNNASNSFMQNAVAKLQPLFLVAGMFYIYLITYVGVFRTCYYFHTGPEILAGLVVSLSVHQPLYYLQCSAGPHWERAREFLFGNERTKTIE